MNYTNYKTNVVIKYKVKLVGWPLEKFASPYSIYTVDELRNLCDALRCGSCYWKVLSTREVSQYVKDIEERVAAGEVIGKKRKSMSDKGTKKGARKPANGKGDDDDDSAGEGPSKRQKVLALKKATKTKGRENRKTGKSKRGPTKSGKSQVPPSKDILTDTDSDTDV